MGADEVILALGERNNRVVTWRALQAAGVSATVVGNLVRIGRLHRHHQGIYLLDPPDRASRITLLTAAVDACGETAALSHRPAAELWGLLPQQQGHIEVTVVARNAGDRPGIRRHRVPELDRADIRRRHGVRVTSPARTILDNSRSPELEEMIATGLATGLVTQRQIEQAIERCPTRRGVGRLRALLRQEGGPRSTRSWAERRLLALIREAGLPVPLTNQQLHDMQVDAVWPEHKLVVEVDSWRFHGDRGAFENDRARDAILIAHGYRVLRFTARQLRDQPLIVLGQLAAALALASDTNARTSAA
ncbi:MAG: DUF559 domain-containing protein [Solirubrobacterales bacterium]|nr:DUF559 domain-containing protein [Solirubrobacterales bacterium]